MRGNKAKRANPGGSARTDGSRRLAAALAADARGDERFHGKEEQVGSTPTCGSTLTDGGAPPCKYCGSIPAWWRLALSALAVRPGVKRGLYPRCPSSILGDGSKGMFGELPVPKTPFWRSPLALEARLEVQRCSKPEDEGSTPSEGTLNL